jgi:D-glycero-D-manno-heptose 1,7-bisphosphate phosphatase
MNLPHVPHAFHAPHTAPLVILDRDGTINVDRDDYVKSPEEWLPLPGALEAMARLTQAGFQIVIATNQSGLARGLFNMDALNAMHSKMLRWLAPLGGRVDGIFFCPHAPHQGCMCRKPLTGLLDDIAQRLGVYLQGVPMVGDSLRDLQAAQAAGAEPHLVLTGKGARVDRTQLPEGTQIHADLGACVDTLLQAHRRSQDLLSAQPHQPSLF